MAFCVEAWKRGEGAEVDSCNIINYLASRFTYPPRTSAFFAIFVVSPIPLVLFLFLATRSIQGVRATSGRHDRGREVFPVLLLSPCVWVGVRRLLVS